MDKKLGTKIALAATGVVAVAGLAIASPAMASSSKNTYKATSSSTTGALSWGQGSMTGGEHGHGRGHRDGMNRVAPVDQSVTVTVPDDGKTYQVVVTDTTVRQAPADAPAGATPPPAHSVVVPVTGTGSVTVKVPGLRPGSYSVKLVAVVSTSTLTVTAPAGTTDSDD